MAVTEAKTETPAKGGGGKRLMLTLKSLSSEAVRAMAGTTLQSLIDERLANPESGDRMPDGSVCAGRTGDDAPFFALPRNADARLDFNEAAAYVQRLNDDNALGHDDWRLPTDKELTVLFNNRAAIGGFEPDPAAQFAPCFWSATPYGDKTFTLAYFDDGKQCGASPNARHESVRAVRGGMG